MTLTGPAAVSADSVTHLGGGVYDVRYTAAVTGTYALSVVLDADGAGIAGSPFAPFVAPAEEHAATTLVFGPGLTEGTCGAAASITLQASGGAHAAEVATSDDAK